MDKNSIKLMIFMLLCGSAVFCADIFFPGRIFSSFYVCVVLISLWSNDDRLLIGSTIGSFILMFMAYFGAGDYSEKFQIYGLINKLVSFVMIIVTAGLASRIKEKSQNLKRLNETLELRVLARIATSEAKAQRLEKQIEILQLIRKDDTNDAFSALDQVINNLKVLATEKNDSKFEALK